ncbi:hypothetical protein B0H10DRAFT_2342518, partial [Mycena sp. CBHHK59/15]
MDAVCNTSLPPCAALTSAPFSSRRRTISVWPWINATFNTESINGPESVFTSAPFARRRRVTSTWPALHGHFNALPYSSGRCRVDVCTLFEQETDHLSVAFPGRDLQPIAMKSETRNFVDVSAVLQQKAEN